MLTDSLAIDLIVTYQEKEAYMAFLVRYFPGGGCLTCQ
jgi:hypothetical protein